MDELRRSSAASWQKYKQNCGLLATGTSTLSKRPQFEPEEPCYIERAQGCRVWDIEGNEYIDFRNALGPITLGYRFAPVDQAIRAQLEKGILFGHPTLLEADVAKRLVAMVPCAEKVRYLKTGGEALAAAIKLARVATGRDLILQCGYNGWLNSLAAGGAALPGVTQQAPVGVPLSLSHLHRALPWGDLEPWRQTFSQVGDHIAAAVVAMDYAEAEQGPAFLAGLRELTSRFGALLITDEIVAGFRIAIGGLHDYAKVAVDAAVFSKGMANGMPLSVVVGKAALMDLFEKAIVSSTFAGETLSLAAARACLDIYRDQDVIGRLAEMGVLLKDGLNKLFGEHGYPLVCRGLPACPMLMARPGAESGASEALGRFLRAAYAHGVSLYTVCYSNFSHTEKDIARALERLAEALKSISRR